MQPPNVRPPRTPARDRNRKRGRRPGWRGRSARCVQSSWRGPHSCGCSPSDAALGERRVVPAPVAVQGGAWARGSPVRAQRPSVLPEPRFPRGCSLSAPEAAVPPGSGSRCPILRVPIIVLRVILSPEGLSASADGVWVVTNGVLLASSGGGRDAAQCPPGPRNA